MGTAADGGIGAAARWSLRLFGGFELRALPAGERVALPEDASVCCSPILR